MSEPSATSHAIDPDRRSALLGAKLRGLVKGAWGVDPDGRRVTGRFPGGATLVDDDLGLAWVLGEDQPLRTLGGALAWAGVAAPGAALHVILADAEVAPVVARQASQFRVAPGVWLAEGVDLRPVEPAPAHVPRPAPAGVESLAALIEVSGADLRLDHGSVIAEWLGLEVAKVVVDPDFGPRLEVGVGRHDREAFTMIHGDRPAPEALASVLAAVQDARTPERPDGPLTRIAREPWLRAALIADPALVGAVRLEAAESTVPRVSVMDVAPSIAVGEDLDGSPLVVACSTGIDPYLVPAAGDARLAYAPGGRLLLVVPPRDVNPLTERLAAALTHPAEIVPMAGPWTRT